MNFGMIILSPNVYIRHGYAISIQIALLRILKQKIFKKILLAILIDGLIHLTTIKMIIGRYP